MTGYVLERDDARGIVICTVSERFREQDGRSLCHALAKAVTWARASGTLHLLFDNRAGRPLGNDTNETLRQIIFEQTCPEDRIAILVPSSVAKGQARPLTNSNCALFLSEGAARMWLTGEHPERIPA